MARHTLKKFEEVHKLPNVLEYSHDDIKAELSKILKHGKKVILELACGGGVYTLALAEMDPKAISIGIDIQGERLLYGAREALEKKLANAFFVRIPIETLMEYFDPKSVDEIWITFPDPYPKKKHAKRRLSSARFLELYQKVLKKGGIVHFKTDDPKLYDFSVESVALYGATLLDQTRDIDTSPLKDPRLGIQTHYEKKHRKIGRKIHYVSWTYPS